MKSVLESHLPKRQLYLAGGLLLASGLPHFMNLKWPVMAFFIVMVMVRFLLQHKQWSVPGGLIKFVLVIFAVWLVFDQYHTLIGLEGGSALLMAMLGLKMIEMRRRRDLYVTLFLVYFLIAIQFLFNQSLLLSFYLGLIVLLSTALLVEINQVHQPKHAFDPIKYAGVMLLQAVPLMMVLFILFPRISSPLWDIGFKQSSSKTGLSSRMEPGSMSNLVKDESVAFRVKFFGKIPDPKDRYWRGPVLWHFDGRVWLGAKTGLLRNLDYRVWSDPVKYQVSLEPSGQHWLMALDLPGSLPPDSYLTDDYQLKSYRRIDKLQHYTVSSHLNYIAEQMSDFQREMALRLPTNVTDRMRALVDTWQQQATNKRQVVEASLRYFNQQPYIYTLNPPLLGSSPTDEFLFETRRGFCEHYASSFVQLMRIAGIPSRVVTGYQGGEYNGLDDYFIVRQSDAHAWAEVWLDKEGWMRVDPTAAVAPERIEHSIESSLFGDDDAVMFNLGDGPFLRELGHSIALFADAINNRWNHYVLQYSDEKQQALLEYLGLGFLREAGMAILAMGMMMFFLFFLSLFLLFQTKSKLDRAQQLYQRFCKKLASKGVDIRGFEGPSDFSCRVAREFPELADKTTPVFDQYIRLRYEENPSKITLKRFKRLIFEMK